MSLKGLMIHRVNIWTASYSADNSGGGVPSYTLVYSSMPCNVQPAPSEVLTEYMQRDEKITHVLFFIDASKTINFSDRVVFKTKNYRVVGRKNVCEKDLLFRLDLEVEQV